MSKTKISPELRYFLDLVKADRAAVSPPVVVEMAGRIAHTILDHPYVVSSDKRFVAGMVEFIHAAVRDDNLMRRAAGGF